LRQDLRLAARLLARHPGFTAVAVLSLGLDGVMSYVVSQRSREVGIRIALGARPGDVVAMIAGQGLRLATIGMAGGLALAAAAARLVSRFVYGVSATDPRSLLPVLLVLGAVAAAACALPARRAARVDPLVALRIE